MIGVIEAQDCRGRSRQLVIPAHSTIRKGSSNFLGISGKSLFHCQIQEMGHQHFGISPVGLMDLSCKTKISVSDRIFVFVLW